MPKFLIDKLKKEYPRNPGAVYGTLNAIGAMHGNKETALGREMEKKHMAKEKGMKKAPFHMTRITHHDDGSHTVEHEPHMKMKGSGAFMEKGDGMSYSAGTGKELMSKLGKHLGIGAAASPKDEEGEMHAAEHEPPAAEVEEDSEGV